MAAKETGIATVLTSLLASGGGWITYDQVIKPLQEQVVVSQNKADATNLVTQKLIEDRIKDLQKQKAAEKDQVQKAILQDRIDAYKSKLQALEAQILK